MSDTNSASVLSDERLAILAVNPREANNALGKEVRAMALEIQSRRASDPVRAELLEALKERLLNLSDKLDRASHSESIHSEVLTAASKELDKITDEIDRAAITRAEME